MPPLHAVVMAGLILALPGGRAAATDFGHQNYLLHCAGCHLPDGRGSAPNDVPTLHRIPGEFVKVPRGREFLAQVPGIAYSPLPDAEVAEILNWMLKEYNTPYLPADFKPYTVAEVAAYRAVRPANIMKVREGILAELAAKGITIDYAAQ
ncbi:MAG: cytochrome c [Gammaproteobacteria bacterium]